MIRINQEELGRHIHNKLGNVYAIVGNESTLINESADLINMVAKNNDFKEFFNFVIDSNTNWFYIFSIFSSIGLFNTKKVINLQFTEKTVDASTIKQLNILNKLLHSDILLVCRMTKLNKNEERTVWFKNFFKFSIVVSCWKLQTYQITTWIINQAKNMHLLVDNDAIKLLCQYYEGNLSALVQSLKTLQLQWPDGKVTESRIKKSISKSQIFVPINWVNALLEGNITKAIYILNHLERNDVEPIILLKSLQYDVMLLIKLFFYKKQKSLNVIMENYSIWSTRRYLFNCALQRLDLIRLKIIGIFLIKVELDIKTKSSKGIWLQLELSSLLMCNNDFLINFSYEL
ncbi:DNA polymerase III subunit delta [Pantoea sp. SoEX]|uniref:DNA polymerase III subunit delta n=1 Tax=Pantoea sp. SoEX TaxID=2576763 RepID=UPI00135C59CE|nr:DNA polymerase III subunit delta [Pantoea sp. SoEX]MXP51467.1 DNA polymerase III subunit delta [Pantoea sp. SoEX]